jgi:trehalose 6-phosphate synthase/phosphatase
LLERVVHEVGGVSQRLDFEREPLCTQVREAQRPLVLLGDGVLLSSTVGPDENGPDADTTRLLISLASAADVCIVSSRGREKLEEWFSDVPIALVCGHDLATRWRAGGDWEQHRQVDTDSLKALVDPVLREFVRRTPGSAIEYRSAGAVWYYRLAEQDHANLQARELLFLLEERLRGQSYTVHRGRRMLEIRPEGLNKRHALTRLLAHHSEADWVLVVGDEICDEPMLTGFVASEQPRVRICAVGASNVGTELWLDSVDDLMVQLKNLVSLRRGVRASAEP